MKNKVRFFAFLLLGVFHSCGASTENEGNQDSDLFQFFENSHVRRNATEDEKKAILKKDGCTAFFIENKHNKAFVMSAKHCFAMDPQGWCNNRGVFRDALNDTKARCKRVIAWDKNYDLALFEIDFPDPVTPDRTLRIAAFQPEVDTQLNMFGYPADKYRQGKLSVTENCWVLKKEHPSPYGAGDLSDLTTLHNCTTYGGNSGGPMIGKGTRLVYGMPYTYYPNNYTLLNSTKLYSAAAMAQMAGFVERHRSQLILEGVIIAENALNSNKIYKRIQQVFAYQKYWTLDVDNAYSAINPGGMAGAPLAANAVYAKGPCQNHMNDCRFDAVAFGQIKKDGNFILVQQVFAYGKYWTFAVEQGFAAINPGGMLGTPLISNSVYDQGPCKGHGHDCQLDDVSLGVIRRNNIEINVQHIFAYGKYWTLDVDQGYNAINPGGLAGTAYIDNAIYRDGPCQGMSKNCKLDAVSLGSLITGGKDTRVQQVFAAGKYWTLDIDKGYVAVNPNGLAGYAYSANAFFANGPCQGHANDCRLDAVAIGQIPH